jgi:hypothetical protein
VHVPPRTAPPLKLSVSSPGDPAEQEADRIANQVMRTTDAELQRAYACGGQCPTCLSAQGEEYDLDLKRSQDPARSHASEPPELEEVLHSSGRPLAPDARAFFEPRFGHEFGRVRVHSDEKARASASAVQAIAYTVGSDIVVGDGVDPNAPASRPLLAHELTHVLQQDGLASPPTPARLRRLMDAQPSPRTPADRLGDEYPGIRVQANVPGRMIQRDCSDPDFCTPYANAVEAAAAESRLRSWYLPADEVTFGATSRMLFEKFLDRKPGDSLAPIVFDDPASDVVDSFATSGATDDDQDAIIDLVGARLSLMPGGPLEPYVPTIVSLANFLSPAEMDERPINYSNPLSIAGHIAGGIGSSDAGPDYRKVTYGNVALTKVPLVGSTGYTHVETTLHYEVFDAVDFCPGDCGSPAEQVVTVPMSRLEASGEAYDVPFVVRFVPESRAKRFFF